MSRILLVEDNRDYAATLRTNLEREGYEVRVAGTGADGLQAARSRAPDLIILDLMLPVMNGFTVLQRLRDEGHEAPVLIMTARGAPVAPPARLSSARTRAWISRSPTGFTT